MRARLSDILGGLDNIRRSLGATWQRSAPLVGAHTVLITGASVGVGLELARMLLAETPHRLILTARAASLDRFTEAGIVEGPRVRLRALNVTDDAQRRAIVDEAERDWGGIDVLVNNAGITYRAVVEHVSEAERLHQMDVNFRAPMALTALVLPGMRAKRKGRVINVSSVGGHSAMPTMAVYSASKFALEGATEALWYECRPWGVRVTLLAPGFINSDGFRKVRFSEAAQAALDDPDSDYHRHYVNMEELVARLMTLTLATSTTVARTIFRTMHCRSPPLRVAGTPDAWMFSIAKRLLPGRWFHLLLYAGLPRVWSWGPRRELPDAGKGTSETARPA